PAACSPPPSMDPVIDVTLRTALALLFSVAAGHQLQDLGRFRATLVEYRLLPAGLVPLAAALVVAVEVAAAGALLVPGARAAGLVSAATLLVVYGAAVAINLARGRRDIDCGCAGPAGGLMVGKGPAVGEPAPVVRVEDLTGTVHDLGGPGAGGRSTLLFFLSPTCPVCKTLLPVLRQVARREGDWLGIVLASDGAH